MPAAIKTRLPLVPHVVLKLKYNFIIHDNACENIVCEMTATLSRNSWVNLQYASVVLSFWATLSLPTIIVLRHSLRCDQKPWRNTYVKRSGLVMGLWK